jgi:hypothetical protein
MVTGAALEESLGPQRVEVEVGREVRRGMKDEWDEEVWREVAKEVGSGEKVGQG